jgi:hypothetical protein
MKGTESMRLSKVQREILEALRDGGIIRIDRANTPWLGDRSLSPQTRYFLTDKRLVERRDKTRSVEGPDNGLVISAKGLALLESLPASKQREERTCMDQPAAEPPTERQLTYARDLGISMPDGVTKHEVSDLIEARVEDDKPAASEFQAFAKRFGVPFTQYIGKKSLFDRLFTHLTRPGREEDMTAWFVFRVYRDLVRGRADTSIKGPDDPPIREIARLLIEDQSVLQSIRRYQGRDLVWFGQRTSPDGEVQYGASSQTVAYKRASSLLREKGSVDV